MNTPRLFAMGLIGAIAVANSGPARAQANPSADQIINSLKPGAGMLGGTRGIRPVAPASPEAAPAPAPSAGAAPPRATPASRPTAPARSAPAQTATSQDGGAPSVNLTVQFATNSASLTPAAVETLSELGRALSSSALATYRFRIEGHTDTVGSAEMNKALSERRAQAVVAFLSTTYKIDPTRLQAVGMGEDGLLIATPPNTAEPRNRRVQVINLGA